MTSGNCNTANLAHTYGTASICFAAWTGTLAGAIKCSTSTTQVQVSSSGGSDTAQADWVVFGY
jgi:hypothetical protein